MGLDPNIRSGLRLPAICAPMALVSGPELVTEACKAGVMAALPTGNARTPGQLEDWLRRVTTDLKYHAELNPGCPPAALAVNLSGAKPEDETALDLKLCARYGVKIFTTAMGNPRERVRRVHDQGGVLYHDVTTVAHAEKAIAAGVDGLIAVGAGGGGHSGVINHLVLIPKIRTMFDGTIVLAGTVSGGSAVRAAEILGADLSYLGTRFIATQESRAPSAYKELLVNQSADQLTYTARVSGIPANWMKESLRQNGLDPENLPSSAGLRNYDHLPPDARPWKTIFSAGQGIDLIHDIPTVWELVRRLRREYVAACSIPDMAGEARLVDGVLDTAARE